MPRPVLSRHHCRSRSPRSTPWALQTQLNLVPRLARGVRLSLIALLAPLLLCLTACGGGGGSNSSNPDPADLLVLVPARISLEGGTTNNGIYAAVAGGSVTGCWLKDTVGAEIPGTRTITRDRYGRYTVTYEDTSARLVPGRYQLDYSSGGETKEQGRDLEWTSFSAFTTPPPAPLFIPESGALTLSWTDVFAGQASFRVQIYNANTGTLLVEESVTTTTTYTRFLEASLRGLALRLVLVAEISDGAGPRARSLYVYRERSY